MEKASLLGQWKNRKKAEGVLNTIENAPEGVKVPLSHSQRRLWFLQQLYPDSAFYNYTEIYRFSGNVQINFLLQALTLVFASHDLLRSIYYVEEGQPFIKVLSNPEISVSEHDVRGSEDDMTEVVEKICNADANHSFDLSAPPVALVSIIRTKDKEYFVAITLHHIAMDKWSMNLLGTEWASHYRALIEGLDLHTLVPKVQYPDFAYWQQNQEVKQSQLEYWKVKLSGTIPFIDLPTDFTRPKTATFGGKSSEVRYFSEETSATILAQCKQLGVTPYVFFLSIYYLFLYRYTGQKDILIGSPISNRDQKQLEGTIGFFNDTIVLRTEISPTSTFLDVLGAVKKTTLEAFSNKEVPFETLVSELKQERSLPINPFFQVMFLYYSVAETASFGDMVQVDSEFYNPGVSKFDLTFDVAEANGRLSFAFEYSTELFRSDTIVRFQDHMALLIDGVVASPTLALSDYIMITADEKDVLSTGQLPTKHAFDDFTGIHHCIEKMAENTPDAIAVTFKDAQITYSQLDARANALAVRILKKTGGENLVIGLAVVRSLDMIVGVLAILKAGGAYLPIDPKYPTVRIDFMLRDSGVDLLVTQKEIAPLFPESITDLLFSDDEQEVSDAPRVELPLSKKDNLAYIIYTSGSTGRPKGVPITHGNILNSTAGRLEFYPENPKSFLLLSSISFDSSKAGIFWTLCTGGNLVVTEDRIEQDMQALGNVIYRNRITHALLLPTLYQLLLEHADISKLESLRTIMVAGEACSTALVETHFKILPKTGLYNEYGPTEATVWCIAHKIGPDNIHGTVPLGKPVANAQILLLDASMKSVPVGAAGEIYVGGAGLSSGYLNRPDLTKKAFLASPFSKSEGDNLYKTGDLARYERNGDILFLGRADEQVKIRGYRVELGEIEKVIRDFEGIDLVSVLAEGEGQGPNRIAAYMTAENAIVTEKLRKFLSARIPDYMVPTSFTQIEAMPLLPNGKIDKNALQKLKRVSAVKENADKRPPQNEIELKLHSIWQDILNVQDIGVNENFFALGGDSILSIQLIAKARKVGINLTPNQIFDNQTIVSLANYIETKNEQIEEWDYLVTLRKEGADRPLFCIHAGGGHVFFYNVLTKYIGAHRPIYALQASGVYAGKEMHQSIEVMAKDYITAIRAVQPEGPYNILVYCFSVAVGHEMALQLSQIGQTANLIVMDTMTDPWKLDTANRLRMRLKGFAKRLFAHPIQTVKSMFGERMIQLRLKMRQKMAKGDDKTLAQLNANLARICETYSWKTHEEKVTLLLTEKPDADINKEVIGSWEKVALKGVKVVRIKGNHINLFVEPEIEGVAKKIDEHCV